MEWINSFFRYVIALPRSWKFWNIIGILAIISVPILFGWEVFCLVQIIGSSIVIVLTLINAGVDPDEAADFFCLTFFGFPLLLLPIIILVFIIKWCIFKPIILFINWLDSDKSVQDDLFEQLERDNEEEYTSNNNKQQTFDIPSPSEFIIDKKRNLT